MSLTARFGGAALVAVCLASPAFADVDPEGRKVLDQMAAYYAQLDGVSYASKTTISMDAMPMPMTQQVTVAVARPNMIATRSDNPMMGGANVTSDGTTMLIEMPAMRIYQMGDAPKDMQNLGDVEMLMSGDLGTMLGVQMLRGGVGDLMFEDIDDLAYEGVVERDGMKAHHLRISAMEMGQSMNLDVWIADGDRPWLMGLKPELPAEATMGPDGQPMNIDMLVTFADWKGERPAASRFAIETPSDYRKVDSLMTELMAGAGEMGMGEPEPGAGAPAAAPPHPTVDKPAPEFTLNTLSSDQPIKLADLKGKVVMLDFWATWCGPCVAGLPTVDKVTREYKDKGVVFYAVNLREGKEKVSDFMQKKSWTFPVLMDNGDVAQKYQVRGIPHSVLIDKTGKIRFVHIGFGGAEKLEAQLRKEFDQLLAEK